MIDVARGSRSQPYHYLQDKSELMCAVGHGPRAELINSQRPYLKRLDSWEGIAAWFDAQPAARLRIAPLGADACPLIDGLRVTLNDREPVHAQMAALRG